MRATLILSGRRGGAWRGGKVLVCATDSLSPRRRVFSANDERVRGGASDAGRDEITAGGGGLDLGR